MEKPEINVRSRRYRQLLAGFHVYLTPGEVGESLPTPRIYTCFRGVPVASEAKVVDADENLVTFKVNRYQANALAETEFALLKSPLHGSTFRAYPSAIDREACLAGFTHFVRHEAGAEQRVNVRLEPAEPIAVQMRVRRKRVQGALLDLSVVAAAVFVRDADPALLQEGTKGSIQLEIPERPGHEAFSIDCKGDISRILAWAGDDPNDFRVVFRLVAKDQLLTRISEYILEQQTAILMAMSAGEAGEV